MSLLLNFKENQRAGAFACLESHCTTLSSSYTPPVGNQVLGSRWINCMNIRWICIYLE